MTPALASVALRTVARALAQDPGGSGSDSEEEPIELEDVAPKLDDGCGEDPNWVCEQVADLTGSESWGSAAEWFVAKPLTIALIALVAWIASRLLRRLVRRSIERSLIEPRGTMRTRLKGLRAMTVDAIDDQPGENLRAEARAQTLITVSSGLITLFVWFIALIAALSVLEFNLGPLLASAGILGIALGFGTQDLVKDFVAGTFVILEDQYGVGDVVDLGEATGTVEKITMRATTLRDIDGNVWHVPNGEVTRVANKSQEWARALIDLDVAYDTDLDLATEVITTTAESLADDPEWADTVLEPPEVWGVEAFGADAVSIRLVVKTLPGEQWKVMRELRRRMKVAFDEAGIEIPFPQRTIWIRNDDGQSDDPSDDPGDDRGDG